MSLVQLPDRKCPSSSTRRGRCPPPLCFPALGGAAMAGLRRGAPLWHGPLVGGTQAAGHGTDLTAPQPWPPTGRAPRPPGPVSGPPWVRPPGRAILVVAFLQWVRKGTFLAAVRWQLTGLLAAPPAHVSPLQLAPPSPSSPRVQGVGCRAPS